MGASIVAGLTSAALAIVGKIFTASFFEAVLSKVLIAVLEKLASHTDSKVDDELVADIKERLNA